MINESLGRQRRGGAQIRHLMERRIDKLPDLYRTVLMLRAVEEMSVDEVAAMLSMPAATVHTRYFRARSLLREGLSREIGNMQRCWRRRSRNSGARPWRQRPAMNFRSMKTSRDVWNDKALDRFLANPLAVVPGSTMTYDGIADPQERADLIAYLQHANAGPACHGP